MLAPCRPIPTATSSHATVRDANPTNIGTSDSAAPTAQVWQPLIAVLGIAYLTEVIVQALRVYRLP